MKHYHFNLACRFVKDFNLPVSIVQLENIFYYELNLYNEEYQSLDKWEKLWELLYEKYPYKTDEQRAEQFLADYAVIRDNIITSIEDSVLYKNFNESREICDVYKIPYNIPATSTKSAYNQLHIGKRFVSVDMKNANFQALKYAGVLDKVPYDKFIGNYCDGPLHKYISESKYTRQVIFGKLNPKRQIMVEKYLMSSILKEYFMDIYSSEDLFKLTYFGSDEFVFEEVQKISEEKKNEIIDSVKRNYGIDIRIESYELTGFEFFVMHQDDTRHKLGEFYRRSCDKPGKFKCVPLPYHKIIYKIMKNQEIMEEDLLLMYEKCMVKLIDEIIVEEIK